MIYHNTIQYNTIVTVPKGRGEDTSLNPPSVGTE